MMENTPIANPYLEQEVLSWSPEKLVLKTYDVFLAASRRRDIVRMNRALAQLMGALNFEAGEIAVRLYRLYEYCQRCLWSAATTKLPSSSAGCATRGRRHLG